MQYSQEYLDLNHNSDHNVPEGDNVVNLEHEFRLLDDGNSKIVRCDGFGISEVFKNRAGERLIVVQNKVLNYDRFLEVQEYDKTDHPDIYLAEDRILVYIPKERERKTAGGLIMAFKEADNETLRHGIVVDKSTDLHTVAPGEVLYFSRLAGVKFDYLGREYLIIRMPDFHAKAKGF